MINAKIQSFAVALGLSTWAIAGLVLTEIVGKSESIWIFLVTFLVSILSMLYANYIRFKKSTSKISTDQLS